MEDTVLELLQNGIATELLAGIATDGIACFGVRLRTFGKLLPKDRMVLGTADTFEGGLEDAVTKAEAGRWEHLDWSARPWATRASGGGGSKFGL